MFISLIEDIQVSLESTNNSPWTNENIVELLEVMKEISGKLDKQDKYYDQFEILTKEQYMQKMDEQKLLDEEQEALLLKEKEEMLKLDADRHEELVNAMDNVATVAGDETTSTTLIDSFNSFKDTYDNNVSEFNEMLWMVFLTFLCITAFKQLGNQIWRV